MKQKIGFIGAGNMASCLISGMLEHGFTSDSIRATEPDHDQREKAGLLGIEVSPDNAPIAQWADILILAVKPQVMQAVIQEISDSLKQRNPLIVSIAAGIRMDSLGRWINTDAAIVRVMPNTPAQVMQGMSALVANQQVTDEQKNLVEAVFKTVGDTLWLDTENDMDTVTAISGSGPAYFFLFMEYMINAAQQHGIPESVAKQLVLKTALGASTMATQSQTDPAVLRQQVTSPGGTTEQALEIFRTMDLEKITADAIHAATQRSIELSRQFDEGDE